MAPALFLALPSFLVFPQLVFAAARLGRTEAAFAYQARLDELLRVRGRANIHSNKLLCKVQGLMDDHVAAPFPRLTAQEAQKFLADCAALGFPGLHKE